MKNGKDSHGNPFLTFGPFYTLRTDEYEKVMAEQWLIHCPDYHYAGNPDGPFTNGLA